MNNLDEKDIDISLLLARYLGGTLNEEQKQELDEWLAESKANARLFEELQSEEFYSQRKSFIDKIDLQKEWKQFEQQRNITNQRKIYLKVLRYAAAIMLPLMVVTYLFTSDLFSDKPLTANTLQPGHKDATLILSTGEEIKLSELKHGEVINELDATINHQSQQLSYHDDQAVVEDTIIKYNTLIVGHGQEYNIELSDGTQVWLNSESRLKYPTQFKGNVRELEIEGEGFFKVAHNKDMPFVVKTAHMDIQVLGTSFNVNAYAEEDYMSTTLLEGSVKVLSDNGETYVIKPDQQVVYYTLNGTLTSKEVDARMYALWIEGVFAFEEESLQQIMHKFSRWYDINYTFEDEEAAQKIFSGKLPRFQTCNELLEIIEKTTSVTFEINNNQIRISSKK